MLAAAAVTLASLAPVVVHDADERFLLANAAAHAPVARVAGGSPAVYGRSVPARAGGTWHQYWLFYVYQDQDRGIVRSGRHAGDWELVQYRVDRAGRPAEAVYAQHSGGERCDWSQVETRGGRPVVYAAHGSHASYLRAGTRDRLWPDPNDEADGRGAAVAAPVVPITATSPRWMTHPGPWGASRARRLIPPEQDSPPGPAFQPARWDPDAFADEARACQAGCNRVGACDAPEQALTLGAVLIAGAVVARAIVRPRRRPRPPGGARG